MIRDVIRIRGFCFMIRDSWFGNKIFQNMIRIRDSILSLKILGFGFVIRFQYFSESYDSGNDSVWPVPNHIFLLKKIRFMRIIPNHRIIWFANHMIRLTLLKTHFLGFLKVGSELFRSSYGIVFELKRPTFKCVFRSKWGYLTSKIKDLGFYIWGVSTSQNSHIYTAIWS